MATIARFGSGSHKIKIDLGIGTVWIAAQDRAGIAKVLRKLHRARLMVNGGKSGEYQRLSYRDIASRPAVITYFTTDKDGAPLIRRRINFFKRAGEMVSVLNYKGRKGK